MLIHRYMYSFCQCLLKVIFMELTNAYKVFAMHQTLSWALGMQSKQNQHRTWRTRSYGAPAPWPSLFDTEPSGKERSAGSWPWGLSPGQQSDSWQASAILGARLQDLRGARAPSPLCCPQRVPARKLNCGLGLGAFFVSLKVKSGRKKGTEGRWGKV